MTSLTWTLLKEEEAGSFLFRHSFMLKPMKSFLKRVLEKDKTALNEFQETYGNIFKLSL